jgi:hypothetical protein
MMENVLRRELEQLLSALCDGALVEAEHRRLEGLLSADPECRQFYLQYIDLHARLLVHPDLSAGQIRTDRNRDQGRRKIQLLRYASVALGTVAASILIQAIWLGQLPLVGKPMPPGQAAAPVPGYVATVTQMADCVWDDRNAGMRTGSRIKPGELRLRKGLARLHFDSGADILVEGPGVLRVDSTNGAILLSGKVVFQADDTAAPFDLRTPSSTLVDFGTEYAVVVGPEGEEVHVFEGEVQRRPAIQSGEAKSENLKAGQARRYGPKPESAGEPVAVDLTGFKREIRAAGGELPLDPADQLLAYEGFDYLDVSALRDGKANGGKGWSTPWKGFARPVDGGDRGQSALNVKESLHRPGAQAVSVGGCFDFTGFSKYYRKLQTPVRLDREGVYYLSFLFRRFGPSDDPVNTVAVLLRNSDELRNEDPRKRLNLGVGRGNRLFTFFDRARAGTPLPLNYGETYLLVAKIVAGGKDPSQVFMRIYAAEEPIDPEEPDSWSVAGMPFVSDLVFDYLEVHINSRTRQMIDEVRLGTSWPSVVFPWLRGRAP